MKGWINSKFAYCLLAVAVFGCFRLYYYLTDDFRIDNITFPVIENSEWEAPFGSDEEELKLKRILSQKFYYLGKGAQSFAFASEDDNYVLKFFKFKHLKPIWFLEQLPDVTPFKKYKRQSAIKRESRLVSLFEGYKTAYDCDREGCGLLFIQLSTANAPSRIVTLYDKLGISHQVDLKDIPFVVQRRGKTLRSVIHELLSEGDIETAKIRIGQVLELYAAEYKLGIYDRDHGVMHNSGFIDELPFHLDVGKLSRESQMVDPLNAKNDMKLVAKRMIPWIKTNHPKYYGEIQEFIEFKISSLFDPEVASSQ